MIAYLVNGTSKFDFWNDIPMNLFFILRKQSFVLCLAISVD